MSKSCIFLDVFTGTPYAGNQLAVFPEANGLTTEQMQKLANEINYSETTFISKWNPPDADYNVRIFTLNQELPFAGHPILGTAFAIMEIQRRWHETIRLKTKVGIIPVRKENGLMWMTQNPPEFFDKYTNYGEIAPLVGLDPDDIANGLPIQAVSTGNKMLIIPVKNLDAMQKAEGNAQKLKEFCKKYDIVAPYLFTMHTHNMAARVHTRFFAPHMGILEDAATGSAAGPLAGYLLKYDLFGLSFEIVNEQGIEMNRPAQIYMRGMSNNGTYLIEIGGQCAYVGQGDFEV